MAYSWDHLGPNRVAAGRSGPFEAREAAERWLERSWEDLLAAGVTEVALVDLDNERVVYRMPLTPQE
jgi:hypothetical protein